MKSGSVALYVINGTMKIVFMSNLSHPIFYYISLIDYINRSTCSLIKIYDILKIRLTRSIPQEQVKRTESKAWTERSIAR